MTTIVESRKREYHFHWIYLLLGLLLLGGLFTSAALGDERRDHRRVDRGARDTEIDFMQRLMDSEYAAVKLAQAGDDKTRRKDMKDYLDNVGRTSQGRINRVSGMMDNWYRLRYAPVMDPKYDTRVGVLRNRDVRGDEFEIRMLKSMIEQRQEENAMISRYVARLDHADLRDIANTVCTKNDEQARRLQSWLKDWYDITYTTPYEPRALPPGRYAPRTY